MKQHIITVDDFQVVIIDRTATYRHQPKQWALEWAREENIPICGIGCIHEEPFVELRKWRPKNGR